MKKQESWQFQSGYQNAMIGTKQFSVTRRDSLLMILIEKERNISQIRQCKGGGLLVWVMVTPNGLISHKMI